MTLKSKASMDPTQLCQELICRPRQFVISKHRNDVIVALVQASQDSEALEFFLALAACIKVYPNIWQFVHNRLTPQLNPLQFISAEKTAEPEAKRRKQHSCDEEEILEACHSFVMADNFFHTLWPWHTLIDALSALKTAKSKWFCVQIIAEICSLGQVDKKKMFNILESPEMYDQQSFEYLFMKEKMVDEFQSSRQKNSQSSDMILTQSLVCIENVLLPSVGPPIEDLSFVSLASRSKVLQEIALSISERKHTFISGPLGCGKTRLVEFIANQTGRQELVNFQRIAMNDQIDGKTLLGNYSCHEVPGQFAWTNGIITKAVIKGDWLLIEDVDQAPPDVLSALDPLIRRRELHIASRGQVIKAHPGFHMFLTSRTPPTDNLSSGLKITTLSQWTDLEMSQLLMTLNPGLKEAIDKMITYFCSLEKSSDARRRPTTIRDLLKWCQRCGIYKQDLSAEDLILEGLDCFCWHLSKTEAVENATKLAHLFNVVTDRMYHLMEERSAVLINTKESFKIGRVALQKRCKIEMSRPYYLTKSASRLLEFISMCVQMKEPALIVGETGVGKTSAIQYLSASTGHTLVVVNLNQQTESCDLIGGTKPVNVEHYLRPVYQDFLELFKHTFDPDQNAKFMAHLANCWAGKRWIDIVKLMQATAKQALSKSGWNSLQVKINQVSKALETKSRLYFAFINGVLTNALTSGQWILLDEINMAEPDVLDCIGEMLNPEVSQVRLQGNETQTINKHPDFRIFAAMNPSTDVGKKELNAIIRSRFTEFFIEEPANDQDLLLIVSDYLKPLDLDASTRNKVVQFYKTVKKLAKTTLLDGTSGHMPTFSLRTLCRALHIASGNPCANSMRSLLEAFILCFLTEVDQHSYNLILALIKKKLDPKGRCLKLPMPSPKNDAFVKVEGYWLPIGQKEPRIQSDYILTESVRKNLKDVARIVSLSNFAVLLQGETSVGKTSMITFLAEATGNTCIRVNNHEHTDVQEYLGSYVVDEQGAFVFQEGVLPLAMRHGYWIILDELNLAPTDVLEALNRVLDDNRELFIPETQTVIKAHANFRLFATQNPSGTYGGRKPLSRAFRNRFIELHFPDLPRDELSEIIEKRAGIARSQSLKLVQVLHELQMIRRNSATFEGKYSFLTLRDLFRWASRCSGFKQSLRFYDWEQHFAEEGYLVLTSRSRNQDGSEEAIVRQVLEKVFKRQVDMDKIFNGSLMKEECQLIECNPMIEDMVWTSTAKRMALLILHSFKFNEPVLLVGETGCGKTRVCQSIANLLSRHLSSVNCHLNTESSDFLGGLRPARDGNLEEKPFEWVDGPLVQAMEQGFVFLIDEISLAEDGVLERLNSVLESDRCLYLMEQSQKGVRKIEAHSHFQMVATMNPGGDFGKRELSPALRNRLVEIWCPSMASRSDILALIKSQLGQDVTETIGETILRFIEWYDRQQVSRKVPFTTRDLVAWMNFIKDSKESVGLQCSLVHGICLVITDGLANVLRGQTLQLFLISCRKVLEDCMPDHCDHCDCFHWILSQGACQVKDTIEEFGILPFSIKKKVKEIYKGSFLFQSPTVAKNALKLLRGLQIQNSSAILMEGSPGVGKSSIVASLASMTGNELVRINLSEQTEISDLIGSDLPSEGKASICFEWHDGPLLAAMKSGKWILLDELNLATQSVLEGLNACLDHRAEIFIPELNKTFTINSQTTKIFATQNPPREGGERKNLPKSFLNRFVKVHMTDYTASDIQSICQHKFPMSQNVMEKAVIVSQRLHQAVNKDKLFGHYGSPWQFNLRDLMRFAQGIKNQEESMLGRYLELIFVQRFRSQADQRAALEIIQSVFQTQNSESSLQNSIEMDQDWLKIGAFAKLPRLNRGIQEIEKLHLNLGDYPTLESLMLCIQNNWLSILVNQDEGQDVSRLVQVLAGLLGQSLHCISLNSSTDTSELLGGFEQTSNDFIISKLEDNLNEIIESHIEEDTSWIQIKMKLKQAKNLDEIEHILKDVKDDKIKDLMLQMKDLVDNVTFDWMDSTLIKAIEKGHWVVLKDANLCNPSVLDRLNCLMEESGSLPIGEKGCRQGQIPHIVPHANFRMFLTMNCRHGGELSPAMRNRGVEIVTNPIIQSPLPAALECLDLMQYDASFVLFRQFRLLMDHFVGSLDNRVLNAFLTCKSSDWRMRNQLCKLVFAKDFQHPLDGTQFQDEGHLLVISELEMAIHVVSGNADARKADDKYMWKHLRQLTMSLKKRIQEEKNLDFGIWMDCNVLSTCLSFIRSSFEHVAIVWNKILKEVFVKHVFQHPLMTEMDQMCAFNVNPYEPLAIDFQEKRSLKSMLENLGNHQESTKKDELILSLLDKIIKSKDSFASFFQFIGDTIEIDEKLTDLEKKYEVEPRVQPRSDMSSLLKIIAKSHQEITLEQAPQVLKSIERLSTSLQSSSQSYFLHLDEFPRLLDDFCKHQLEATIQNIDKSRIMSSTVKTTLETSDEAPSLIKSGLLTLHISSERSLIDIADQLGIESKVKSKLANQLQNDMIAYDSCQALFVVDQDQLSNHPMQVQRRHFRNQAEDQAVFLEQKKPHRDANQSYSQLLDEMSRMKNGAMSIATIDQLVLGVHHSLNGVQKCQSWLKSVVPFLFNISQNFSSFQDIWVPFVHGCCQVVIGMIQHCRQQALSARQDVIDLHDQLRYVLAYQDWDESRMFQCKVKQRDFKWHESLQTSIPQVLETIQGGILMNIEEKLIYLLFQEYLSCQRQELNDLLMPKLDMCKIVKAMIEAIKEKYQVSDEEEDDDNMDPFVSDTLKVLNTCLSRSIKEHHEKFLVPLENMSCMINERNKHQVKHKIIPVGDLESLLIRWRKNSHAWSKLDEKICSHLNLGVDNCLKSLLPFLKKMDKKLEALTVPFMLFCHNAFLGDMENRLKQGQILLNLISADEPEIGDQLRTIFRYFSCFQHQSNEALKSKKKDLKTKFDVQIKTNKRLYEEANIKNHFKAAHGIVREASKKLGELCLSQARVHFAFKDGSLQIFDEMILENVQDENFIADDLQVRQNQFVKALKSSVKIGQKCQEITRQTINDWADDAVSIANDILENKNKKLTFHVVKTKASNMMTSLKDLGSSKAKGASFDVQTFRILQCLSSPLDSWKISRPLLQTCFELEQLSSSLLLPVSSHSKAFGFCRLGQDLASHGVLVLVKAARVLIHQYKHGVECQMVNVKQNEMNRLYQVYSAAKKSLAFSNICQKLNKGSCYGLISSLCQEIVNQRSFDEESKNKIMLKLDKFLQEDLHFNVSSALQKLKVALVKLDQYPPDDHNHGSIVQASYQQALAKEVKTRFLALQTVIKKMKSFANENPLQLLTDVVSCLEILDMESFNVAMNALTQMNPNHTSGLVFRSYIQYWSFLFQFAMLVYQDTCHLLKNVSQTLKLILDYKYSEGKEEDEEQESDKAGDPQSGCGLGEDAGEDGGKATTTDVDSEDIFDSAEKPQKEKDEEDKNDQPKEEEDGFEADNVQDENPQAPEENEDKEGSDSEDDDKENEMDAEEGKADEDLDEDAWEDKNEEEMDDKEETEHDNKEKSMQEKAAHDEKGQNDDPEDKKDEPEEKIPEDENKRQRKDEQFENEEEIEMDDETYGKNEPPEPEDLDMDADEDMLGDDDDNDDNDQEMPPEEDQRLPDFEDVEPEEDPGNEQRDEEEDAVEMTKSSGGNAGQDEAKEEEKDQLQDEEQKNDDDKKEEGSKVPNQEKKEDDDGKDNSEGDIIPDEKEQDETEKDESSEAKNDENSMMTNEEIEQAKEMSISQAPENDENDQDEEITEIKNQEFAHTKDKKNTLNALDAMMDIDEDEKPKIADIEKRDEKPKEDGKTLDMSKLEEAIQVQNYNVERSTETIFGQSNQILGNPSKEIKNVALENFETITDGNDDDTNDVKKWLTLCQETSELTQNLTEQLRLILESTRATRFKGDYKSGKRINMRKVIPFIASNYRKDKIWLRRTKPSKRDYNVVLAVDDSTSMKINNVNQIVDKSMAVVCQTLSALEVGKLGVVKFGKQTQIVQHLRSQFSQEDGVRLLKSCQYDQEATHFIQMMQAVEAMFKSGHGRSCSQLLLILSDGRGIYNEGKDKVIEHVRRLKLANIFTVFLIIENDCTESVLDMKMALFDEDQGPVVVPYLEQFPFSFYLILKDIVNLPQSLSDSIRQWFDLVSKS